MKKTLITVLAVIMASGLFAQSRASFGIKGGANFANLRYKNLNDPEVKLGFHVGALAHIHVNDRIAVQPEILFSRQGAQWESGNKPVIHLDYINIPVLLQYMVAGGFRLETGPQVGFLVNAERKESGTEENIEDTMKDIDFSWTLGIGYLFPGTGFGIDARYNFGISDITRPEAHEATNSVFQAGIFYQFSK